MTGLRKCMEPPDYSLEDVSPLLNHQWVYHPNQLPDYWAKIITKHYTAFSIQVREGVIISKMSNSNDLWVRVVSEGKRKLEATDNEVKVLEADKEVGQRLKKQTYN